MTATDDQRMDKIMARLRADDPTMRDVIGTLNADAVDDAMLHAYRTGDWIEFGRRMHKAIDRDLHEWAVLQLKDDLRRSEGTP